MLELFGKHEGPQAYVLRPLNSKNALGKVSQISGSYLKTKIKKQTNKPKPHASDSKSWQLLLDPSKLHTIPWETEQSLCLIAMIIILKY